ncbi:sulfotransferase family cytosolic 1B member 1-like [Patiria miniata]|uniref:Sulfotransferase domain-containing protein n=1 Tax=Patiria miniata TaxID=46514 RepID=A0A913ZCK0_PATMI|nr:sulfotransferase family cytosolic 1B member 1-like [Patiria miniata]
MPLNVLRGMPLPWRALDSNLQGAFDLDVRKNDVFVISYPKSGTTWLRNIISYMLGCPEEQTNIGLPLELSMCSGASEEELQTAPPVYKLIESWLSPRVIMTHLLPHLLPAQLFQKNAKVLYIARNPKDIAVSYFHFFEALKAPDPCPSWEQFVPLFMKGEVPFGSYFTHVKQYWEMKHHNNFLFLKYEDLKKEEQAVIKQVGAFLGKELDIQDISSISSKCSLESMRKRFSENTQAMSKIIDETKTQFVRKGKVGDWREYLTAEQSQRFDQLYEEHLGNTGLTLEC